jgi:adenylate cyclase class 1
MSGKEGEESGDEAGALRDLAPGGELGRVSVRNADLAGIELENNTFEKTSFNSLGLGAAAMSGCSFESCRLVGVDFRDAEIETDTFTDCVFEHCVFAGAYLDSATFTRCTFKACYFGAATLSGPRITACLFMECDFWGVRFTRAKVTSCSLTASSFAWATLSNSVFRGVAWRDCVFDRTFFDRSDLCGSSSRAGVFSGSRFHQTSFDDPEFLAAGRQALDANMLSNRSKHTAMPSAMNGAAVARLLDRWFFERDASRREEALLAQNRRRMLWAISKWGGRAAEFVKLLPLLLETEAPVPGGGAEAPACRLPGYEPDYDTLRLAEKYLGGESRTALAKKESICVEGLYSIGSVGTIAQTHTSDLDLWLCYEPGAIDEQRLEAVKARIADIEAWADKEFGLEVHFFVMDLQSVRDNNFGFSDKESAGSTQAKLLKEEFYRTVALLAGKKPAWWCVPPKSTAEQYFSALHKLGRSPDFRDDCLIDLGHLDEVAKEEFFGASLWQIVKALKRPFKSVLKFAVLDRYFASGETGVLFCDRIKENLFSGARDLWDVDAYAVLFREVYEFYRRAGNEEAMDLMRRAFRQKTRFNLQGRTTGRPIEMTGASFMEYFHPVSDSRVERDIAPTVGAVKAAEEGSSFTDMVATGRKVSRFMFSTYDSVQDKLAAEKLEAQVSMEDMTKLGRKIFAGFKQKPGKVMLVPFVDPPQGLYSALDIQCLGKPGAKSVWIVRGMRNEAGQEGKGVFEEVGRDHHPVSLAAWLTANEIYDPKLHVQGGNLQKPISLPDLTDLLEALDAFFPHADTFNTDIEENLNDERAVKVFTVVNMMTIREEKAIRDAQVIYSTNWGELFCLTNPGGLHLLEGDPMDFVRANVPHASGYGVQAEFHIPRKARCPRVHSA